MSLDPKKTKEVWQFLGLASYYRRFFQNLSAVATPLHALTSKGAPFCWDQACTY